MIELEHEFAEVHRQVPTELQMLGGVYLLRAGRNEAKPNYAVGPRVLDCFSFHFILEGRLQLTDEERSFTFRENQMFCLFPHASYSYRRADASRLSMYWLAFSGAQAASIVAEIGLSLDQPAISLPAGKRIFTLVKKLHSGMNHNPLLQQSILYDLFSQLKGTKRRPMPEHAERRPEPAQWLNYCKTYIDLHFSDQIRIDELASEVSVHRSYFSDAFRQQYGRSPKQYLVHIRMLKAEELLRDTELPINEIALSVGYPDPFSFTRAFVNYYGVSPSNHRRAFDR